MIVLVGVLEFLCLLVWGGLMLFLYAAGGGHPWNPTVLFLYCGPLVYFVLSFVSTLPFVKSSGMAVLGLLAHLALLPFLLTGLGHGIEGLFYLPPFLILSALWYFAYRKACRREEPVSPTPIESP